MLLFRTRKKLDSSSNNPSHGQQGLYFLQQGEDIDRGQLEQAAQLVNNFLEKLREGIEKRKETICILEGLANELDKTQQGVNIVKATGSSAAVAGGVMAIAGGVLSVFTFGLATPLIVGGIGTAVAGGVTAGGAEIAELVISKGKMEEAQRIMNEDKDISKEIDDCYTNLTGMAEKLTQSNPKLGTSEQLLCALLLSGKIKGATGSDAKLRVMHLSLTVGLLVGVGAILARTTAKQTGKIAARVGSRMARVFAKGVVEGASGVARTVLRGVTAVAVPVILAFDVYELVKVSIDIHEGSKSAAAGTLREIARGFEQQLKEMEEFLEELENQAQELEDALKEEFRNLIEEISQRGEASEDDVAIVWRYLQMCNPSEDWCRAFNKYVGSPQLYVFHMARIFKVIEQRIERYKEESEEEEDETIDLTFIAHGEIMSPMLPCALYYLGPSVESVTLYEPWGCAVDAAAVYGIATGSITIDNVQYTDTVLPCCPSYFNILPRDYTMIPMVVFTHVKTSEDVYRDLMQIASVISGRYRGLVIPYFQSPGDVDLPEIPLWALTNVVAVCGLLLGSRFRIHVAACLTTRDASILCSAYPSQYWPTVNCQQYCTVPVKLPSPPNEPVTMTCGLPVPDQLRNVMSLLNRLL